MSDISRVSFVSVSAWRLPPPLKTRFATGLKMIAAPMTPLPPLLKESSWLDDHNRIQPQVPGKMICEKRGAIRGKVSDRIPLNWHPLVNVNGNGFDTGS